MTAVTTIVLAAGRSSRFAGPGAHKLLAPVDGVPLVRFAVQAAVDAGVGQVVVVTGAEALGVERAIAGLDVRVVHEPAFGEGMANSLRRGLLAAAPDTEAVIIALGDQPFVRGEAYRRLVTTWRRTASAIVVPRYARQSGPAHPVLFAAAVFEELLALRGDVGAREVIARDSQRVAVATLDWEAPGDVDTRDDLQRLAENQGGTDAPSGATRDTH